MSYNGSGTFQINTTGQPVVTGTVISSTAFNALTADLATGLSTAITKDGQTATTARIPFAAGISSTLSTDATSTGTGSIITSGGIGITKALWVGGLANFASTITYGGVTLTAAVTGTGKMVLDTSPILITPNLGTPSAAILTNATGTAAGLTVGNATAATTATNLAGGLGGSVPYQSAAGTTAMLANGTAGQVLQSNGTTVAPSWATASSTRIQPISASVAASALTISASALSLDFRSTTLGSGTVTTVSGTPANLVISSGSTLGTVSAQQSRIVVIAMNNAGTIELATVNISGGNQLDETNLITTTAEGGAGAADSANVIYSTTARTSVAYRVIGFIDSTQATAGTWATAPSTIQGVGGQALSAMSSLGYGQTWQDVTASRASGTTYYNSTGKPITVLISVANSGGFVLNYTVTVAGTTLNNVRVDTSAQATTAYIPTTVVVPPGASYSITITTGTLNKWLELR